MSDDLMQKFSGLVDMAEGGLQSKVHEQALRIQAQAKELCPVRRYGSGLSGFIADRKSVV